MYLKALEIQGFKSFPDKTVLTFEQDITAIVGPNGSGKSNISDAVRWVMGEQSTKALRGGKMEDVIFGGTAKRPQTSFAEVSLIIDNSDRRFELDSTELMITRRYYRSGESEYYINKGKVRLKDVRELLMDTGLGQEGYSIIGQGRIDEILSARSTDRREIFEEAAGISRYRHRKEEAERKLERTAENLTRVNDKIAELEYQVEPLRRQAEVARRYIALRDELRGVEISVWLENLARLSAAAETAANDLAAAKNGLEEEQTRLETLYSEAQELSERMRRLDVDAETVREQLSALDARTAEADSAAAVLEANLKNNEENIRRIDEELSLESDRVEGLEAQIAERNARRTEIEKGMGELDEQLVRVLESASGLGKSTDEALEEIERLRTKRESSISGASEARVRSSALQSASRELEDRRCTLELEAALNGDKLAAAVQARSEAKLQLDAALSARDAAQNRIEGYSMRVAARERRCEESETALNKMNIEIDTLGAQIKMLEDMEREFKGYSAAVRTVMQESGRRSLRGIHGPVANLVRSEQRYAYAVETALGGSAQNIVVDDEAAGKAAITMLKNRSGGRATFMPLSTMRGRVLEERGLEQERGYEGLAAELVSCDERYRGIVNYILGRTVIVTDIDAAIAMSKRHSARFAIVTLDGQVMNRGGSMTGGSSGRSSGVLSRANELEEKRKKLQELELGAAKTVDEAKNARREAEAARYELETARTELRASDDLVLKLETEMQHHDLHVGSIEQRGEEIEAESSAAAERIGEISTQVTELEQTIRDFEDLRCELDAEIDRVSSEHSSLVERGSELADELGGLRVQRAALESELAALADSLGELTKLRDDFAANSQGRALITEQYRLRSAELEAEIAQKRELAAGIAAEAEEKRAGLKKITEKKLGLEAERTQRERDSQGQNERILNMQRECSRLEQRYSSAELEQRQITDKLWDSYELGPTAARQFASPMESLAAATKRVGELKRSISSLGTPNLGAIDEFEGQRKV